MLSNKFDIEHCDLVSNVRQATAEEEVAMTADAWWTSEMVSLKITSAASAASAALDALVGDIVHVCEVRCGLFDRCKVFETVDALGFPIGTYEDCIRTYLLRDYTSRKWVAFTGRLPSWVRFKASSIRVLDEVIPTCEASGDWQLKQFKNSLPETVSRALRLKTAHQELEPTLPLSVVSLRRIEGEMSSHTLEYKDGSTFMGLY